MGPHVLQSLLMAFERWLLDVGRYAPHNLYETLLDIQASPGLLLRWLRVLPQPSLVHRAKPYSRCFDLQRASA